MRHNEGLNQSNQHEKEERGTRTDSNVKLITQVKQHGENECSLGYAEFKVR